ncbi:LytR family transcriptional regulator [Aerococcus agrisoli]|uniref:LytR family transcriptional regulator n=1 Tax=Aerococcus agrisoli TaxID=2487350 RepID=A0A3N4G4E8_9LACT|nr:LCP family protein [Aerococcus agrisoli]RPA57769.1 LytR family transcriptional regulator [Aerococcus agrisoli]
MAEERNSGRRSRRDQYGDQPRKKRRGLLGCFGWILLLLLVIGGGVAAFSYYKLHSTAEAIYQPADANGATPVEEVRETEVSISEKDPVSILLLGMDAGAGRTTGEQNTDVMILVTINPEDGTAKMVSIPRDTYVASLGGKINSAYATAGGPSGSINAVQNLLNVPVDYYALVNMTGMMNIIDAVGGVTVYNDFAFSQDGYTFAEGNINLATGDEALAYVRMRYNDPDGDFGRAARQREVLIGILDKYQDVQNVGSLLGLFETVQSNVTTDLTINDMTNLALNYRVDSANIESTTLVGSDDTSSGIYYSVLSDAQIAEASSMLRSHLGLE